MNNQSNKYRYRVSGKVRSYGFPTKSGMTNSPFFSYVIPAKAGIYYGDLDFGHPPRLDGNNSGMTKFFSLIKSAFIRVNPWQNNYEDTI